MADLRTETHPHGIRILTMDRAARRNALSLDLIGALGDALRQAETEGLRAVVIAGEGPAFSAGADFADLAGDGADQGFDAAMGALTAALGASPLISFAAMRGPCIGAGLDLALACDFRVAASDAVFGLPSVKMGILYNPQRLAQVLALLAPAAAARLLLLAERIGRDEALAAGIVTHPAAGDDPLHTALALAERAAALPPGALAATKGFLAAFRGPDFDAADWQARRLDLLASDERREALRRARENRT